MSLVTIVVTLAVGFLLLAIELIVLPGFGITGVLGLIALAVGSWAVWIEVGPEWGAGISALSLLVTIAAIVIFPRTRFGRRMVLQEAQRGKSSIDHDALLVGQVGTTVTPCRPVGIARFGERETQVVTDGSYVEPNTEVRVVQIEGSRIVVEEVRAENSSP
jgi:membrane-bound ClpP family serine protease